MKTLFVLTIPLLLLSCENQKPFDVQGHRGWRGMYPENSIEGFKRAIDLGVSTLEMDVICTKDFQLVLQHDPVLPKDRCSFHDQDTIFKMTFEELAYCYCGHQIHEQFPLQKPSNQKINTLSSVLQECSQYSILKNGKPIYFNIEIKSEEMFYDILYPRPDKYVQVFAKIIHEYRDFVTLQSFDPNILNTYHSEDPALKIAFLIEGQEINSALSLLNFTPNIISPDFNLLSSEIINELHKKDIEVIPWTVNSKIEMDKLISWNVDGLITDYPDSLLELLDKSSCTIK